MKKLIMHFLFLLIIISNCFPQSSWFLQQSGTTNNIKSINFLSNNLGIAVGDGGLVIKTTNGGSNWIKMNPQTTAGIRDVQIVNDLEVYAILNNIVIKSTNGGLNWFIQYQAPTGFFEDICFVNPDTGIIASSSPGSIKSTTNGGLNWTSDNFGFYYGFYDVSVINSKIYVSGSSAYPMQWDGTVLKSTNAGQVWNNFFVLNNNFGLTHVFFPTETNGYVISNHGYGINKLTRTTNTGMTWNSTWSGNEVNDMYFPNGCTGYIVTGIDSIYKSTDCGQTFILQGGGTNSEYLSVYFVNELTGWVAGTNGAILKTTNGGVPIGIQSISSEIPNNFSLSQNYPNPFNPQTKIKFELPSLSRSKSSIPVKLVIYDLLGREVTTLVNEELRPGTYEADWDGSNYSSGVYFYKIISNEFTETRKMVLMK